MVVADIAKIEEQIRNKALTKGIRTNEFFYDYDALRSGYVTASQFFRVIWENFSVKLSEEEEDALANKYDLKRNGRLNYRRFCDVIDRKFDSNKVDIDPVCQQLKPRELLGTSRTLRPLSPNSEEYIEKLLRRVQNFYGWRGISLWSICKDFDNSNMGVISETQFYRCFVKPPGLTDEDIALLAMKYRDPDRPGLINYVNLSNDLVALGEVMDEEKAPSRLVKIQDIGDYLPHQVTQDSDLQSLLDRLRLAVYKNQIRILEFFKDYDRLRCGLVTENQFIAALNLAVGKEAHLTESDMMKLAVFYRASDGRVHYRELCEMLEFAFNVPDLEKKPTQSVVRPPQGSLGRVLPILSDAEEKRVEEVVDVIREEVRTRRLTLYSYFQDYENCHSNSRLVTPSQFGRVLSQQAINVNPEDLRLLCKKFQDLTTGDINYPGFVQTVDLGFVNYAQNTLKNCGEPNPDCCSSSVSETVDFDSLMERLRHHVLVNRIRVAEYFQDFDPLRTGKISKPRFQRGLSAMGLSSIGQFHLSQAHFGALCTYYEDPNEASQILWSRFEQDLENVFTIPHLDKQPSTQVPPSSIFVCPKPGTMDWRFAQEDQKARLEKAFTQMSARARVRNIDILAIFRSFDKLRHGHVSRPQFRQALGLAELNCSVDDMMTIEAKYCDDEGVNYMGFIQELLPEEERKFLFQERMQQMRITNNPGALPERDPGRDLETVMLKIKTKVHKERVRVIDWFKVHDKLNSGRVSKQNFRRALNLCHLELQESEVAILEDRYQASSDPNEIEYVRFSDDVESIFAIKHLEKMPTLEVELFRPPEKLMMNKLLTKDETKLNEVLTRLADKVKVTRPSLYPLFQDFDPVNTGAVSKNQFRRVLMEMDLASDVATESQWNLIFEKFATQIGGREDVSYHNFCDVLYGMAGFPFRRP